MMSGDRALDLAVCICTHNSMRTIECVLESVREMASHIVVVDSGSTDGTIELCEKYGAKVIRQEWLGHVKQKQLSMDHCAGSKWTLLLDSDESLEPELQQSVRETVEKNDPAYDGWDVNRKIWFMGGWLQYTFQPEWRLRLVRTGKGKVVGEAPHDRLEVPGKTGRLRGDVRHDSWADLADMTQRHLGYAKLAGQNVAHKGSLLKVVFNPPAVLFKQLFFKRGILDGWRGVIMAGMMANSVLLKHAFMATTKYSQREGKS